MKALNIEAVQAFVLVADLKSFTRAAEAMKTSQSAVSLRIKRLEKDLGQRLFERTPRQVRLSGEGNVFLNSARALVAAHQSAIDSFCAERRRLIVGISYHVVGAELPRLLKRMNSLEPDLVMEIRLATTNEILADYDRGALDAAIVLRHDGSRRDGEIVLTEEFGWMAAPDFRHRPGEPLRLATQAEPCGVRKLVVTTLGAAGIAWEEVFVGGGIVTVSAAVTAGIAIAALGRRVSPPGTVDLGSQLGLPPLPSCDVMLYHNLSNSRTRSSLHAFTAAIRSI